MGDYFARRIVDTGRLPLFCFFVAFIATFVLTRISVRLIRKDVRWWFKNVGSGDLHIHHVVFGVVLTLLGGVGGFAIPHEYTVWYTVAATVFGMGAALILDEFSLILHLRDVYWEEDGRSSVDAVFVAIGFTGLLLVGMRPIGVSDVHDLRHPSAADAGTVPAVVFAFVVANLLMNLVLAIVTVLKGKIWSGLVGLFVPLLLVFGAIRLARPGSPWARWRYPPDSKKYRRALGRERRYRYPIIRFKIRLQEFIAGRHDLLPPVDRRRRRN